MLLLLFRKLCGKETVYLKKKLLIKFRGIPEKSNSRIIVEFFIFDSRLINSWFMFF
jgi:hypothetical protein